MSDLQRCLEREAAEREGGGRGEGGRESGLTEAPSLPDVPETEEEMDVSEEGLRRLQEEVSLKEIKTLQLSGKNWWPLNSAKLAKMF